MLLLSITKLRNLKAIHNRLDISNSFSFVVINHKTTKFESNSQRAETWLLTPKSRYQSQNYKIWKQFTTKSRIITSLNWLLSITKLQNLKATHNLVLINYITQRLLSITKLQNLKATHNDKAVSDFKKQVVINHKTTKFESNSQL